MHQSRAHARHENPVSKPPAPARPVFSCRLCGECCRGVGGIVLRGRDQARLAEFLQLKHGEFMASYTVKRRDKTQLRTGSGGCCVFFDPQKLCTVHPARPDICRAWPFFRGNLVDPASLRFAKEACPGIDRDVSFADFTRTGFAALAEQGLLREPASGCPSALRFSPLPAHIRPEHGP